jgi:arylsulfatase A-like enzyme
MDAHVSIADVFPTICTAIGADIPLGVQGRSLWPMLTGKSYPKKEFSSVIVQQGFGGEDFTRDEPLTFAKEGALQPNKIAHFDELNTWTQSGTERMVRKDDWKLVLDNYGRGELYNLKADPSEINNLYNKKKYASKQMELLEELMTWELRVQDPLPVPRNRYHFKRNPYNYHFEDKKK